MSAFAGHLAAQDQKANATRPPAMPDSGLITRLLIVKPNLAHHTAAPDTADHLPRFLSLGQFTTLH